MSEVASDDVDWGLLDGAILKNVFGFLHPTDQLLSRLTCKAWRQVAGVPVQTLALVLPILDPPCAPSALPKHTNTNTTSSSRGGSKRHQQRDSTNRPGPYGTPWTVVPSLKPTPQSRLDPQADPPFACFPCATTALLHLDDTRWGVASELQRQHKQRRSDDGGVAGGVVCVPQADMGGGADSARGAGGGEGSSSSKRRPDAGDGPPPSPPVLPTSSHLIRGTPAPPSTCIVSDQLLMLARVCQKLGCLRVVCTPTVHRLYQMGGDSQSVTNSLWFGKVTRGAGWAVLAPRLRALHLQFLGPGQGPDPESFRVSTSHLLNLQDLRLACTKLPVQTAVCIAQLHHLLSLSLKDSKGDWVHQLKTTQPQAFDSGLTRLTSLSLDTPGVQHGVPWVCGAPRLQSVKLQGLRSGSGLQQAGPHILSSLSHLTHLSHLSFQSETLSQDSWHALHHLCPELSELHINGWPAPGEGGGQGGTCSLTALDTSDYDCAGLHQHSLGDTAAGGNTTDGSGCVGTGHTGHTGNTGNIGVSGAGAGCVPTGLPLACVHTFRAVLHSPAQLGTLLRPGGLESTRQAHLAAGCVGVGVGMGDVGMGRLRSLHLAFMDQAAAAAASVGEQPQPHQHTSGGHQEEVQNEDQGDSVDQQHLLPGCACGETSTQTRPPSLPTASLPTPWPLLLSHTTLTELNIRQSHTLRLTDAILRCLPSALPSLEVLQFNGHVGGISQAGWCALRSCPSLSVLAVGRMTGPRPTVLTSWIPPQLRCLSLLNANLVSSMASHKGTPRTAAAPAGGRAPAAAAMAAPGKRELGTSPWGWLLGRGSSKASGGTRRGLSAATAGAKVAGLGTGEAPTDTTAPTRADQGGCEGGLPTSLLQLSLRFCHLYPSQAAAARAVDDNTGNGADSSGLLGLVGALPRLRHLELFTFADSVMPAHASMEECEAAWAQLGPLSSSLCSLALSLQVHTANPSPTQYRAMLHQVARLRRLRRLNLQAHSAYFEFERADLRALARMTGLVELKFGVMGGTEHAATNTAGVSHGSGSGAESIGSRQGGSGVLGVGAGASTGSSAEGGGSHRGGQVLGYDDVARELALMLPQCRFQLTVDTFSQVLGQLQQEIHSLQAVEGGDFDEEELLQELEALQAEAEADG